MASATPNKQAKKQTLQRQTQTQALSCKHIIKTGTETARDVEDLF